MGIMESENKKHTTDYSSGYSTFSNLGGGVPGGKLAAKSSFQGSPLCENFVKFATFMLQEA